MPLTIKWYINFTFKISAKDATFSAAQGSFKFQYHFPPDNITSSQDSNPGSQDSSQLWKLAQTPLTTLPGASEIKLLEKSNWQSISTQTIFFTNQKPLWSEISRKKMCLFVQSNNFVTRSTSFVSSVTAAAASDDTLAREHYGRKLWWKCDMKEQAVSNEQMASCCVLFLWSVCFLL